MVAPVGLTVTTTLAPGGSLGGGAGDVGGGVGAGFVGGVLVELTSGGEPASLTPLAQRTRAAQRQSSMRAATNRTGFITHASNLAPRMWVSEAELHRYTSAFLSVRTTEYPVFRLASAANL